MKEKGQRKGALYYTPVNLATGQLEASLGCIATKEEGREGAGGIGRGVAEEGKGKEQEEGEEQEKERGKKKQEEERKGRGAGERKGEGSRRRKEGGEVYFYQCIIVAKKKIMLRLQQIYSLSRNLNLPARL